MVVLMLMLMSIHLHYHHHLGDLSVSDAEHTPLVDFKQMVVDEKPVPVDNSIMAKILIIVLWPTYLDASQGECSMFILVVDQKPVPIMPKNSPNIFLNCNVNIGILNLITALDAYYLLVLKTFFKIQFDQSWKWINWRQNS